MFLFFFLIGRICIKATPGLTSFITECSKICIFYTCEEFYTHACSVGDEHDSELKSRFNLKSTGNRTSYNLKEIQYKHRGTSLVSHTKLQNIHISKSLSSTNYACLFPDAFLIYLFMYTTLNC